jgi:hypothetical protein
MHKQSVWEQQMIEVALLVLIVGLAISNLTHILTEVDLFESPRRKLSKLFLIGKVFSCKFCQSTWLALAASIYISMEIWVSPIPLLVKILILWHAIHWVARRGHKLEDGLPVTAIANVNVNGQGSGS